MKLYKARMPIIARDIIGQLVDGKDIDVSDRGEAEMDIQSVLSEYQRMDRELTERAKDMLERGNLPYGQFGKIKRMLAEENGLGQGPEAITWICNQILETFMQSRFIEEIFASDSELRRKMQQILKAHLMFDEQLDAEVRQRIKNLSEGTQSWEVEYAKVMDQIKRKRGIKD